jgi:hypothetical protein
MHPALKSCALILRHLRELIALVRAGVGVPGWLGSDPNFIWPKFASKSVAGKLRSAIGLIEAYLRRVLLTMALEIEKSLVDNRRPLKRVKDRKRRLKKSVRFPVQFVPYRPLTDKVLYKFDLAAKLRRERPRQIPKLVPMGKLYRRLDWLWEVAENPVKRATRLAYNLARRREGPIIAPNCGLRMPQRYGTEISLTFSLMATDILLRSKVRPPQQAPPQWYGPSVTVIW